MVDSALNRYGDVAPLTFENIEKIIRRPYEVFPRYYAVSLCVWVQMYGTQKEKARCDGCEIGGTKCAQRGRTFKRMKRWG